MLPVEKKDDLSTKARQFAKDVMLLNNQLQTDFKEFDISRQLKRSGTSIMANLAESKFAQSRKDFVNKLSIAAKEANESLEWVRLLYSVQYIDDNTYTKLSCLCSEIIKILCASIKTCKKNDGD